MSETTPNVTVHASRSWLTLVIGSIQFTSVRQAHPGYECMARALLPASCHDELATVIRRSDCSAHDVYRACRALALGCESGRLVRRFAWLDYAAGGLLLSVVAWMYLLIVCTMVDTWGQPLPLESRLQLWGLAIANAVLGVVVTRQFIAPQLTARKAMAALRQGGNDVRKG